MRGKKRIITYIEYNCVAEDIKHNTVPCYLQFNDLSLQPHWSEPATQISFAVMMAGALPHPGSVTGTMTVAT